MVDIETTGTNPDRNGMIQLAAVRFNLRERAVDTSKMFDRCLQLPTNRYWDEDTRRWWAQQNQEVLRKILFRAEPVQPVLEDFAQFVGYTHEEPIRFWAKPTTFDYMFVSSYFKDYGVMSPFNFRLATDMNSYIRGLAQDASLTTFKTDFVGNAHDAIVDVLNQIDTLFKASDHYAR